MAGWHRRVDNGVHKPLGRHCPADGHCPADVDCQWTVTAQRTVTAQWEITAQRTVTAQWTGRRPCTVTVRVRPLASGQSPPGRSHPPVDGHRPWTVSAQSTSAAKPKPPPSGRVTARGRSLASGRPPPSQSPPPRRAHRPDDEGRTVIELCATCGVETAPDHPEACPICADERQYVPASGQRWTNLAALRAEGLRVAIADLEPDLWGLRGRRRRRRPLRPDSRRPDPWQRARPRRAPGRDHRLGLPVVRRPGSGSDPRLGDPRPPGPGVFRGAATGRGHLAAGQGQRWNRRWAGWCTTSRADISSAT